MQPCWHPDGQRIAWIAWNHPQMPWDGTTLTLARVTESSQGLLELGEIVKIAGGDQYSGFWGTILT